MTVVASITTGMRLQAFALVLALAIGAAPAFAQHAHPAKTPVAAGEGGDAEQPAVRKPDADPHADHAMPAAAPVPEQEDHAAMDHAAMGHGAHADAAPSEPVDHAAMGHGTPSPQLPATDEAHAATGHDAHTAPGGDLPAVAPPVEPIPPLTDADRRAAFPDVAGHGVHDDAVHAYWLLDRLEAWDADHGAGLGWETVAWVGTDLDRLWLRSEGERVDGHTKSADIEVLYGRAIARWWDLVVGVRHDFGEGPSQTSAAIGVQGLAPYRFEVEATAYVGPSGQTAARFEVEYDILLSNRLILQWLAEAELHGKDDPRRGIGSGLGKVEAGLRLRYEFSRRFAPYIGVVRERAFGGTADFRRDRIDEVDDTRFVVGIRTWF